MDLSNPTLQGVVLGGLIGLVGVVGAAIAGFLGAVFGARIGANAARETARLSQEVSAADREAARLLELERFRLADDQRRRDRGVKAAEDVLDALNEVGLGPFNVWRALDEGGTSEVAPDQRELDGYFGRLKRHALFVDDEAARDAIDLAADVLYGYHGVTVASGDTAGQIWWKTERELKESLGAYVRGEPVAEPSYLRSAKAALEEYHEMVDRSEYQVD